MTRRRPRRCLALLALALVLAAALPCAMLAGSDTCCGAAAPCGIAGDAPCAQLAAAPCCGAAQAPLEASAATPLPLAGSPIQFVAGPLAPEGCTPLPHRPPPAALNDHRSIRDVVLQL